MRPYHSAKLVQAVLAELKPCPHCHRHESIGEVARRHDLSRDTVYRWLRAAMKRDLRTRKQGIRDG